jgi:hypothetical protein
LQNRWVIRFWWVDLELTFAPTGTGKLDVVVQETHSLPAVNVLADEVPEYLIPLAGHLAMQHDDASVVLVESGALCDGAIGGPFTGRGTTITGRGTHGSLLRWVPTAGAAGAAFTTRAAFTARSGLSSFTASSGLSSFTTGATHWTHVHAHSAPGTAGALNFCISDDRDVFEGLAPRAIDVGFDGTPAPGYRNKQE